MAMTTFPDTGAPVRQAGSIASFLRGVERRMAFRSRSWRVVDALRDANDHILADLGLTRGQWARLLKTSPATADRALAARRARSSFRPL